MKNRTLIIGDVIAIAILTYIGFATHGETDLSYIPRMGTTFFPILIGWFLLAPWFGLFDEQVITNPKNLWRIILVLVFSAPLATVLRSFLLGNSVIPIFVAVVGATNSAGMIIWRWIYTLIAKRQAAS